ncbi:hypothetical protein LTR24_007516 [Lithohypha guttulata]|uniref:Glycosyltransferase family 28 N-terminal domain-containing protein n=1 Tax=Lithohypha guttulata TaxID=1690604 RepID=A0ABR0K2N0_9EURO|nr:hypothetical protein LTR24_007516 [Lithohypha guttulata]
MSEKHRPHGQAAPPQIVVQQGQHALGAAAAAASEEPEHLDQTHNHNRQRAFYDEEPVEQVPPPPYDAGHYGEIDINQNGLNTGATVGGDGRVNIKIKDKGRTVTNILAPILAKHQFRAPTEPEPEPEIPEGLGMAGGLPPPPMNIVIQIVGSRGDVQPFVALGQVLKKKFNHRVRIATHPTFRQFVTENDLEFFSIGGDPAELMAFMVKNPGLMPGIESLKAGDIGKRRKSIYELINGCWRSCIETGDGTGASASDDLLESLSTDSGVSMGEDKPFVADAIIANPPSFAHIHIAEKLGIPLHMMFTMPWSPTQAFPHPLANIISSNTDQSLANYISYVLVDMLTWQGLGDLINKFRERVLHLEPVSIIWAPGMLARLKIPWTYCWSPALIPKPRDWGSKIDVSGFFFLNLATNYTPAPDLAEFLGAGPPPVYIGFGSIVVDDPNAMTSMIFEAVKKTGQRALVSKGWGGLGADELGIPEGVFMLGNCPHDWLFKQVSCVVHHGGAGTTAAGIAAGCPTVVVPFFGDQPFWGAMTAKAGAGPMPIPYKELTADKLAGAITEALRPQSKDRAIDLSNKIKQETGADTGAESFHKQLQTHELRCTICPGRVAVWRVRRMDIRLSALAATVLGNEGLLNFEDLKLHRPCEYFADEGPPEPISGGAASLIGMLSEMGAGVVDMPAELLKSLKFGDHKKDGAAGNGQDPERADSLAPPARSTDRSRSPSNSARSIDSTTNETETKDKQPGDSTYASTSPGTMSPRSQTSQPHAISSVFNQNGSSRNNSRPASPNRATGEQSPSRGSERNQMTLESIIDAAKAGGKIGKVGLKSPMDFTMSLAQGFHNAPKLYGDTTVRKPTRVTDFQSGLAAAGKEFGYGFYDGITGLVTQPIKGAQKEGAAGFVKGFAKGAFGLVLKPGASIWGLPGYTFKGIYMELTKRLGSSTQNYIIAARTAQGFEEWKQSGAGERERIIATWKSQKLDKKRGKQKQSKERATEEAPAAPAPAASRESSGLLSGFKHTKNLSFDERKELARKKEAAKQEEKERKKLRKKGDISGYQHVSGDSPAAPGSQPDIRSSADLLAANEADFEEAIKRSVSQTSRGNPQQDKMIERALRASMNALRNNPEPVTDENEEEAYQRAVQASVEEAERARREMRSESQTSSAPEMSAEIHLERSELQQALNQNQDVRDHGDHKISMVENDNDNDTEDDEDYRRAIEASRQPGGGSQSQRTDAQPATSTRQGTGTTSKSAMVDDEDEDRELREALAASMNVSSRQTTHDDNDDDEELRKAMTASQRESKDHEAASEKQKTEEEIVLEYVKKQSLLEEQHRQQRKQ